MFTWENDFKSHRPDGRVTGSLGALYARLRDTSPRLSYDLEALKGSERFAEWQREVKATLRELLRMPSEDEPQPAPVMLSSEPRDGYHLEKWEFYPDRYSAVPILLLRPDGLTRPAPGVLCIPGSASPKELLAGEPMPSNPNCCNYRFDDRNAQTLHCVKRGYIAVAFDNPGTAEVADLGESTTQTNWSVRVKLVEGYIEAGLTYVGVSVFQKMQFLKWFKMQPDVDASRLAVMGHSLGTEAALSLALLCDEFKALVFNDFLCDERRRYCAMTEFENAAGNGNWHHVPGIWQYFAFPDMLAALAPKYLALNEGGAEEWLDKVRASYANAGASDRLSISSYPKFADTPPMRGMVPLFGLDERRFYEDWCHVDAPDHSFRPEPSMKLLEKAFGA
ncbi:MAG: acetylxylan esterase [Victivallales bacterium]|nr:acetylxylan esterase [Victivallales bacterium]